MSSLTPCDNMVSHTPHARDRARGGAARKGQAYWRSLEEFADTQEFREFVYREFPAGATEMLTGEDRRHFLKIMGASMALAGLGLSGCRRWPEEQIAPFAHRPEGRTPGEAQYFATSVELGGVCSPLLARSYDGRPVKLEGNPEHPASRGATTLHDQAAILDLYDPDRSRFPITDGRRVERPNVEQVLNDTLDSMRASGGEDGGGLAILSEASSSLSMQSLRQRLANDLPNAAWFEYEPVNNDATHQASQWAFGDSYRPQYRLDRADIVVTLDADFMAGPSSVYHSRQFADGRRVRRPGDAMNRLYAVESRLSLTGANADHRMALKPSQIGVAAAWLAARVLDNASLGQVETGAADALGGDATTLLENALADLLAHRGRGVVLVGDGQPAEVNYLAHLMNEALGNAGASVSYVPAPDAMPHAASLRDLVQRIGAGEFTNLVIIGGNPVYDAPADVDVSAALNQVATSLHLSDYYNETSQQCTLHFNRAHPLESWGDGRAADDTITLQQPLIQPLFDGLSPIELIARLIGDDLQAGHDIVRRTMQNIVGGSEFEDAWHKALHNGFIENSATAGDALSVNSDRTGEAASAITRRLEASGGGFEVAIAPDYAVYDGRFANNGWLQELPDPITKLTWDNALAISPREARERGLKQGDVVSVTVGDRTIPELAVIFVPGQPDGAGTVTLGYGRAFEGRICNGAGFNVYPIRTTESMGTVTGASLTRVRGGYPLATTQDHHAIDVESVGGEGVQDRMPGIVREATLDYYNDGHERFANDHHYTGVHVVHKLSLFEEDNLEGAPYRWAMSVDLTTCTGCSACVVACQAENNIPIVGKDQVMRSREMHWMRIDRYFKFGRDADGDYDPNKLQRVAHQPMLCMHCENAPCESVCPVAATTHDENGLNVMIYNRCIGTRYCSNNCPYKVRRFNYFDWHRRGPARAQPGMLLQVDPEYYTRRQAAPANLHQMQMNPDVTVRVRGIMEKCTYCIQRIVNTKIRVKNEWVAEKNRNPDSDLDPRVPVPDGAIQTACQQACPTRAIVFGDLNDPDSEVSQLHRNPRTYQLLEELNVDARTRYLARLHNVAFDSGEQWGRPHGDEHHDDEAAHGGAVGGGH